MERLAGVLLLLLGLWLAPGPASACPGCAAPGSAERVVFLPTAATNAAGQWRLTAYEIVFPSVAYGLTDSVQLNLSGTFVPTAEVIVVPGAKVRALDLGRLQVSGFGALGMDFPFEGRIGFLPVLGAVSTYCGFPSDRWCASGVVLGAVPFSARGADRGLDAGLGGRFRASRRIDVLAEVNVHAVFPDPQVGVTGVVAGRVRWRRVALDAGWLMDVGLRGPAFPFLGTPGVPLLNVEVRLP